MALVADTKSPVYETRLGLNTAQVTTTCNSTNPANKLIPRHHQVHHILLLEAPELPP